MPRTHSLIIDGVPFMQDTTRTDCERVLEYLDPRGVIIVEHNSGECPFSDSALEARNE